MKIHLLLLGIILSVQAAGQQKIDLVISNPAIISVANGCITRHQDILISGNKISGIVPHRKKYSSGVVVADAREKYVIPGLWDMHIHFGGGDSLQASIINGPGYFHL